MADATNLDQSKAISEGDTAGSSRPRAKVIDYQTLRAVIGGIVILLVPFVYIGNWGIFIRHPGGCIYNPQWIPGSLSGFYYTHMRNLFVGAMCAVGVFLAAYRGHDRWDDRLTNLAGLAAICIALFPTLPPGYKAHKGPNPFFTRENPCRPSTLITYHLSSHQSWIRNVHVVSLLMLFLMVFLMVLVQFTRTNPSKAEQQSPPRGSLDRRIRAGWDAFRKWWKALSQPRQLAQRICDWLFNVGQPKRFQNMVFVACAGVIALSASLALFTAIWSSAGNTVPLLLFAEVGAFWSFGIAWCVKSAPQKLLRWIARRSARMTRARTERLIREKPNDADDVLDQALEALTRRRSSDPERGILLLLRAARLGEPEMARDYACRAIEDLTRVESEAKLARDLRDSIDETLNADMS
jgi:hypothetical protein